MGLVLQQHTKKKNSSLYLVQNGHHPTETRVKKLHTRPQGIRLIEPRVKYTQNSHRPRKPSPCSRNTVVAAEVSSEGRDTPTALSKVRFSLKPYCCQRHAILMVEINHFGIKVRKMSSIISGEPHPLQHFIHSTQHERPWRGRLSLACLQRAPNPYTRSLAPQLVKLE